MHNVLLTAIRIELTQAADRGKTWLDLDNLTQAVIDELRDEDGFTIQDIVALPGNNQFTARIGW